MNTPFRDTGDEEKTGRPRMDNLYIFEVEPPGLWLRGAEIHSFPEKNSHQANSSILRTGRPWLDNLFTFEVEPPG